MFPIMGIKQPAAAFVVVLELSRGWLRLVPRCDFDGAAAR